jgi:hypothetical protein
MEKYKGTSLFEILISTLLLSIAFLGLDAAHITSFRAIETGYNFMRAEQQMNAMMNRLLLTKGENIDAMVSDWNLHNSQVLPRGHGVVRGNYPEYIVALSWGDIGDCETDQSRFTCLSTSVVVHHE